MNEFEAFLQEHNISNQFHQYRYFYTRVAFKEYIKDKIPKYYIMDAFKWSKTEHGSEFWEKLNNKWLKLIENK